MTVKPWKIFVDQKITINHSVEYCHDKNKEALYVMIENELQNLREKKLQNTDVILSFV